MSKTDHGVDAVIEALAVYRATRLLQQDDLPPLPQLREQLMERYGASPWSALLDCPWCLSPHLAVMLLICKRIAPGLTRLLTRALAASAVTGILSGLVKYLDRE